MEGIYTRTQRTHHTSPSLSDFREYFCEKLLCYREVRLYFVRNTFYLQSWAKHHWSRIIRCKHRLRPRRQYRSKPHCFHRPAGLRQCDAGVVRRACGCRWLHPGVHLVLCPMALRLPHGGGWAKLSPGRGARWHQDHLEWVCGLWSAGGSYH